MSDHPSPTEIRRIAAVKDATIRNLLITQCYCELSAALQSRTGPMANWCTFATWASRQAGQSIRKEDLFRSVEARLKSHPLHGLNLILDFADDMGVGEALKLRLQDTIRNTWLNQVIERTGAAVAKGNKKVFEEIGREFARFLCTCFSDKIYSQENIDNFCAELLPGEPPNGQEYLRRAFTNYYRAFFEEDPQLRTELQLLANLEIGYHEQIRLQPEILASLNSAVQVDTELIRQKVTGLLFPEHSWWARVRLTYLRISGKASKLDEAIGKLISEIQSIVREQLTIHLMTLSLPPDLRLSLAKDLTQAYPECLVNLSHSGLVSMLAQVDPLPGSLSQSGAVDWSSFSERIHFIAELFRCYHLDEKLYVPAFTSEQILVLKQGGLPKGHL